MSPQVTEKDAMGFSARRPFARNSAVLCACASTSAIRARFRFTETRRQRTCGVLMPIAITQANGECDEGRGLCRIKRR